MPVLFAVAGPSQPVTTARYPDEGLDLIMEIDVDYATVLLNNCGRLFAWLKSKLI
jgi:hypothetical protein